MIMQLDEFFQTPKTVRCGYLVTINAAISFSTFQYSAYITDSDRSYYGYTGESLLKGVGFKLMSWGTEVLANTSVDGNNHIRFRYDSNVFTPVGGGTSTASGGYNSVVIGHVDRHIGATSATNLIKYGNTPYEVLLKASSSTANALAALLYSVRVYDISSTPISTTDIFQMSFYIYEYLDMM